MALIQQIFQEEEMARSGLTSEISKLSKQKMIPANVVDVLGDRCSIRLSSGGKLITNLKYFGNSPSVGSLVYVDYRSGTPMVYTSAANLESSIANAVSGVSSTSTVSRPRPVETVPPQEIPHNLRTYTWVLGNLAVGRVLGPRIPEASTILRIDSGVDGTGTTVTFNIEICTSFGTTGSDVLFNDMVADDDGETASYDDDYPTIENDAIAEGNWLVFDISDVTGAPGQLVVSMVCEV